MKLFVLVVRDVRADAYGNPFVVDSVGRGERSFADEINRAATDNVMYQHPEDFELYHCGFFDPQTGRLEPLPSLVQVMEGQGAARRAKPAQNLELPLSS